MSPMVVSSERSGEGPGSEAAPSRARSRLGTPPGRSWRFRTARRGDVESPRARGLGWAVLAPAAFLVAGFLAATSSVSADGTQLRPGRYGDVADLVRQQTRDLESLRAEARALSTEVTQLSEGRLDGRSSNAVEELDTVSVPAGLSPMRGPGLTIALDDAPVNDFLDSDVDPNFLVVHQQDIQSVVNAMWAGGAEAMTIQGQRVISTTGIKCVGSTVVLHGVPYSPPYVITAIGDPEAMLTSINESPYIDVYRDYADRYDLGWDVAVHSEVEVPAYDGVLELDFARQAGDLASPPSRSDL